MFDRIVNKAVDYAKKQQSNGQGPLNRRADGTQKGNGYFGKLMRPDGGYSTEISVGVQFNGKETEIPLLVPTLTKDEIDYLLNNPVDKGSKENICEKDPAMFKRILYKAIDYAKKRISNGQSPFAEPGETPATSGATPSANTQAQINALNDIGINR